MPAPNLEAATITQVAVIGAGTLGRGIAMSFASAGFAVTLIEARAESLERAMSTVRRQYESAVSKGKLTEAQMQLRIGRIQTTLELAASARSVALAFIATSPAAERRTAIRKSSR